MNKKILIVGGGIGGLVAGIYARQAGFEAEIYEQNAVAGGECTGWDREGYHIDNCIHWLIGTRPGTELNRLWRTVGALEEGTQAVCADRMYTSELGGERVTLWADIARTERELLALSPRDAEEIRRLMKACRLAKDVQIPAKTPPELMGPLDAIRMTATMGAALRLFKMYEGQDTRDLMQRFHHPLIRCLISDFCTAESLAHSFPMAYGNFAGGDGGIPRGGSRAMALRMQDTFIRLGGRIFTGRRVGQIVLDGDAAGGIRLSDGAFVAGDYVVPACDTQETFERLMPKRFMPALLREMYADREAYPVYSPYQAAFAVDCAEDPIGGDFILDGAGLTLLPGMTGRVTVKSYAYEPGFAPEGKQVVQALTGGPEALYAYWAALHKDPSAYRAKKTELAMQLAALIEARFAKCRGRLRLLDAWTPMTYARYMNAYKGYYQSFTITKRSAKVPYPPAVLEGLTNVVLAGQWVNPPGGVPGAATAGKFAIQRILHKEGRNIRL